MKHLLQLAFALGLAATAFPVAAESGRPEVLWAENKVLFWAEAETGAVHVIGLRNGVTEFGVLRSPRRRAVERLEFDPTAGVLTVWGDDAVYRHDGRSLRLLGREEVRLARNGASVVYRQGTTKIR